MKWRSACSWKPATPWISTASRKRCWTAMAPSRARPAMPTTAWWRAGWPSAACASSSFIIGAGIPTARPTDEGLNVGLVKQCKETDQPTAALLADLKAQRPAGRYAGGLGRGIRPHAHAGQSRGGEETEVHRPRPSSLRLHHLDGGRRREGGHEPTARPTIWAMRSSRIRWKSATCTRPCCICWASIIRQFSYTYQGLDQKLTGVKPARIVSEVLA